MLTKGLVTMVAVVGVVVLGAIAAGQLGFFTGHKPEGVRPRLAAEATCPEGSQNCISTTDPKNSTKEFPPLKFKNGSLDAHKALIKSIMKRNFQADPLNETADYLHFEVQTTLMKYTDDVEFFFDVPAGLIQMRSASRLGRSDLGANYKRLLKIEFSYLQSQLD